jgi:hypothetical protein
MGDNSLPQVLAILGAGISITIRVLPSTNSKPFGHTEMADRLLMFALAVPGV